MPPPGDGKVQGEGKKGGWCTCSKIVQAHHVAVGGVWTRSVVGYTLTWASLGFPTGLVRVELRSW